MVIKAAIGAFAELIEDRRRRGVYWMLVLSITRRLLVFLLV